MLFVTPVLFLPQVKMLVVRNIAGPVAALVFYKFVKNLFYKFDACLCWGLHHTVYLKIVFCHAESLLYSSLEWRKVSSCREVQLHLSSGWDSIFCQWMLYQGGCFLPRGTGLWPLRWRTVVLIATTTLLPFYTVFVCTVTLQPHCLHCGSYGWLVRWWGSGVSSAHNCKVRVTFQSGRARSENTMPVAVNSHWTRKSGDQQGI